MDGHLTAPTVSLPKITNKCYNFDTKCCISFRLKYRQVCRDPNPKSSSVVDKIVNNIFYFRIKDFLDFNVKSDVNLNQIF